MNGAQAAQKNMKTIRTIVGAIKNIAAGFCFAGLCIIEDLRNPKD